MSPPSSLFCSSLDPLRFYKSSRGPLIQWDTEGCDYLSHNIFDLSFAEATLFGTLCTLARREFSVLDHIAFEESLGWVVDEGVLRTDVVFPQELVVNLDIPRHTDSLAHGADPANTGGDGG